MTNEERDLITAFIQRVGGQPVASGFAGSVPPTAAPPLPPVEPQADALIAELFARFPEARYRITQMAFVQEHGLMEAQNRINRLEWELSQAQQAAQQAAQPQVPPPQAPSPWGAPMAQQQPPPQPPRGVFGNLFAGRQTPPPYAQQGYPQQPQYAPPPPQYAPGYQPGMFQGGGGSGFLGSALTTAAGVAGGMVAGHALMNMFSGHNAGGMGGGMMGGGMGGGGMLGGMGGGGLAGNTASPWASPAADPYAAGGAPKDSGWTDAQSPSGPAPTDSGWSSPTSDPGAGWQDSGAPDSGWSDPEPDPGADAGGDSGWSDPDQT